MNYHLRKNSCHDILFIVITHICFNIFSILMLYTLTVNAVPTTTAITTCFLVLY